MVEQSDMLVPLDASSSPMSTPAITKPKSKVA